MEIAVFSDIHGNYTAFGKCVEYALKRGIDTCIFLGDYLGEFPYPQKTMEMIYGMREKYACFFVRGNKEDYWINCRAGVNCDWRDGNETVGAMRYCYGCLTGKDIDFFESLPVCREIVLGDTEPLLACHGSPDRNNEGMFAGQGKTERILSQCGYQYILCGHTHVQGMMKWGGKTVLNPGAVGVALHSGGEAQFMILRQEGQGWRHEFVSLAYDREKVLKEMEESGLEKMAPHWCRVTEHLLMNGTVAHGTALGRAMEICREEYGSCEWYRIPAECWEKALKSL